MTEIKRILTILIPAKENQTKKDRPCATRSNTDCSFCSALQHRDMPGQNGHFAISVTVGTDAEMQADK